MRTYCFKRTVLIQENFGDDGNDNNDDEHTVSDEQWWPKNICVTFQSGQWRSTDYPKG